MDSWASIAGSVRSARYALESFRLRNERRVLDEALIVFGPSGRQLTRGIDGRRSDRVPAPAEASRPSPDSGK